MALNSDIRDQAYQFFIEEAPELLHTIETGLLTLREERTTAKVHEIMRAAHSLKGGSASVGLAEIKTLAHRLEDTFKALYDETVEIDATLEDLFLQAYDCLKNPLMEQIETGSYEPEIALQTAEPIFGEIESLLGDSLNKGDQYIPSSSDLGIDIVSSIFEVDVAQGLERLEQTIAHPQDYEVVGELRAQAEVFAGFAELLNLPGLGEIASAALSALDRHPDRILEITQLALADFQASREQVLAGDRERGGSPSSALLALAEANGVSSGVLPDSGAALQELSAASLDDVFGSLSAANGSDEFLVNSSLDEVFGAFGTDAFSQSDEENGTEKGEELIPTELETSLEDVFGNFANGDEPATIPTESLDEVFGNFANGDEPATIPTESLDEVFGGLAGESEVEPTPLEALPSLNEVFGAIETSPPTAEEQTEPQEISEPVQKVQDSPQTIEATVQSVRDIFEQLPSLEEIATNTVSTPSQPSVSASSEEPEFSPSIPTAQKKTTKKAAANLSIRVDFERLERMNNLVGELAINRNSLSLQNDQLQGSVKELLSRFERFQKMTGKLRELSDQMLVKPMNSVMGGTSTDGDSTATARPLDSIQNLAEFDALEMDSYGAVYSSLQGLLEEMIQLEESVDDIVLFARSSDRAIEEQRQMLTNLRDELMWARMLPLGEVLNRFPRVLRDLSNTYHKPVKLKLGGTGVLVDKAALEKLYDPLLHLLRNAFDHGIEPPDLRRNQGKNEEGQIEIRAYHQGNQTLIEIKDDGRGLNLEKIVEKALTVGLATPEQLSGMSEDRIAELIFEPGFSTAAEVSELSGRGVGLDVVRSQLKAVKGNVSVTFKPGQGTTFILRLPLTMTISKLLVCLVNQEQYGSQTAIALPSDSVEEIIIPQSEQLKKSSGHRFLHWQNQIIPIYRLSELLTYNCALPERESSKSLSSVPTPEDWALPLLLIRRGQQLYALEVNRLVSEQELVIKPFGRAMASPVYNYGCTILGDGTLIPVINGATLLNQFLEPETIGSKKAVRGTPTPANATNLSTSGSQEPPVSTSSTTVLVVDDSATLRRTLALTLQKTGYRVLQARDGREALEQLQQSPGVNLVICDVEMPNMNGFEFLGQRRRDPALTKIPVAMLTSRSSDKHRQLATHLGASAYFTKPFIEQQFLKEIDSLIKPTTSKATPVLR